MCLFAFVLRITVASSISGKQIYRDAPETDTLCLCAMSRERFVSTKCIASQSLGVCDWFTNNNNNKGIVRWF